MPLPRQGRRFSLQELQQRRNSVLGGTTPQAAASATPTKASSKKTSQHQDLLAKAQELAQAADFSVQDSEGQLLQGQALIDAAVAFAESQLGPLGKEGHTPSELVRLTVACAVVVWPLPPPKEGCEESYHAWEVYW